MLTITLKRPLATLVVAAGLLAAAGPAGAAQAGPPIAPASYELVLDGIDCGWSSPGVLAEEMTEELHAVRTSAGPRAASS